MNLLKLQALMDFFRTVPDTVFYALHPQSDAKKCVAAGAAITYESLIAQNKTAGVIGLIALCPAFQATGGTVSDRGDPIWKKKRGLTAVVAWLEADWSFVRSLCCGVLEVRGDKVFSVYYNRMYHTVLIKDVLAKMQHAYNAALPSYVYLKEPLPKEMVDFLNIQALPETYFPKALEFKTKYYEIYLRGGAYGILGETKRCLTIARVLVNIEYRKKGVFRDLLKDLTRLARELNYEVMVVEGVSNPVLNTYLTERAGFVGSYDDQYVFKRLSDTEVLPDAS